MGGGEWHLPATTGVGRQRRAPAASFSPRRAVPSERAVLEAAGGKRAGPWSVSDDGRRRVVPTTSLPNGWRKGRPTQAARRAPPRAAGSARRRAAAVTVSSQSRKPTGANAAGGQVSRARRAGGRKGHRRVRRAVHGGEEPPSQTSPVRQRGRSRREGCAVRVGDSGGGAATARGLGGRAYGTARTVPSRLPALIDGPPPN